MKKLILSAFLFVMGVLFLTPAKAVGPGYYGNGTGFDPIQITSQTAVAIQGNIPIPAPGSNLRNCITEITTSDTNFSPPTYSISVYEVSIATYYAVDLTTGPVIENWPTDFPLCLGGNNAAYLQISTGIWKVNISGYKRTW